LQRVEQGTAISTRRVVDLPFDSLGATSGASYFFVEGTKMLVDVVDL
jgi:hypothetical protein